ncbi:MAG: hypothetical protein M3Z27_00210 [Actinomycetota bacterium]|nr:hypothetical protein [Actinomycetota bacterium]
MGVGGTKLITASLLSMLVLVSWGLCPSRGLAAERPGASAASDSATELSPFLYTAIDGHKETLVPWQGQHVSVLVEPGPVRDPVVMSELVAALDRAWSYYAATTGRLPGVAHSLNGRDEIAEVTSTCGAGCTYLGATGTEILTQYFETLYQQVAQSKLYDQVAFYELGRSFWFWSPQLAFKAPDQDPVVTGFAVLMRFRSMAAAGVAGAPYNGAPFTTFAAGVEALAREYEADPSLTFAGTLAQAKSPGAYGGTDFWASLMLQLAGRHGGQIFLTRFFHHAGSLPAASSTPGAVTNWVRDASYAACTDLAPVFYARWGFPRPDGSVTPRPTAASVPEPPGSCTTLSAGRAHVKRGKAGVLLTCVGVPGARCKLTLVLTVRRATRGRVVGIGRHTLAAGRSEAVRVRLNRTGRRLLAVRHHLRATLTVTELGGYGAPVIRRRVTF